MERKTAAPFFSSTKPTLCLASEVKSKIAMTATPTSRSITCLQRMEVYRGLAILATNMKSALDAAFLRRLRFIVRFQFPGPSERKAIWQRVFPADMPKQALDYDRLARLNVTGGHIHNIAINAAFLAARTGSPVTMALVLDAARAEFRKIERPINEADFRWQEPAEAVA